jgi:dTMP kinase
MMTISLAIRTFSLKGKAISEKKIEKANLKDLVLQRKPLSYIYKRLLVFDYAISNLLRLWPYFILRRGVICDRYAYDAIVGLAINQLNVVDASDLRTFVNMLHRIVPDPDVIFLIDVPPEVALQRKRDIPSLEFVRVRREVYKLLGKEYISMVVLNGAEPLSELQKKIIRFLELEKLVPSGGK